MSGEQPVSPRQGSGAAWFVFVSRVFLGGMFIWMGAAKATDPVAFLKLVREYNMIADDSYLLLNFISVTLPWLEILCGLLLVLGVAVRGTGLLLFLMLSGFTTIIIRRALGIADSEQIGLCSVEFDCGCGGGPQLVCKKIAENIGLTVLSLIVMFSRTKKWCAQHSLFAQNQDTRSNGRSD